MINRIILCFGFSFFCFWLGNPSRSIAEDTVKVVHQIDWPAFLQRHDLLWDRVPKQWHEGAFLGNGLIGTMIWAQPGESLHWDVGRSDVTDRGGRLAIGRFELVCGQVKSCEIRLDLWNAEARGSLLTGNGKLEWTSLTHAIEPVTVVDYKLSDNDHQVQFEFRHEPAQDARKTYKKEPISEQERNPAPAFGQKNGIHWCLQAFKAGGGYVVAWSEKTIGQGNRRFAWTVDYFPAGVPVPDKALASIARVFAAEPQNFVDSHRKWWHSWWPQSFLSIPDTRLESFYWIQMYKLGSATRADRPAIDLMGPWFRTTPWPRIWWNLNIQLTYWPVYASNRLDIGESLVRMLDAGKTNLMENVPKQFRQDSAGIGRTSSYDCRGQAGSELGNLTWALHNYWLQYRYSGDEAMLRERLFPLLKMAAMYLIHNLQSGKDGFLHFPVDVSPEYPQRAPDTNYNLALLRWALRVLLATNDRLALNDPFVPRWRETLEKLVPYPYDEKTGYMIGAGVPLGQSHRHFSHLLLFYPLHIVDADDPGERRRLERSLDHWISFEGALQGYSFTGASAMSSWLRRKEAAVHLLDQFLDRYVKPNTMYLEAGPVIETPLAGAASVHEILLQSATPDPFDSLIRVFPAVPDTWKEVTIQDLRTEGAFLVSAARREGHTRFVQITSLAGNPCQIETGLAEPINQYGARKFNLTTAKDKSGRAVTRIDLKKGETILLISGSQPLPGGELKIEAVSPQPDRLNVFGSKRPTLVKQEDDGNIRLSAKDAVINGSHLMLEHKNRSGNLGRWTQPADWASWYIYGAKPGQYRVTISYATPGGGKKISVGLELGKSEVRQTGPVLIATTKGTGSWEKFLLHELGTLEINEKGRFEIIVRGLEGMAPGINLEKIELVPINKK